MNAISAFLATAVLPLLLYYVYLWHKSNRTLPPGPFFNPFGVLFGRTSDQATRYLLGFRKFGDMCCLRVLGHPCIYLNTHHRIRQVFVENGDITSSRLSLTSIKHRLTAGRGLIFNDGYSWHEQRRFVLKTFKEFGFGRGGSEQIVRNEVQLLLDEFDSLEQQAFDPRFCINKFTCNIICVLVFGRRCGSDPKFNSVYNILRQRILQCIKMHHYVEVFLFRCVTRFLPTSVWTKLMKKEERVADFMDAELEEHKRDFCNNNGDCLMDAYLREVTVNSKSVFNDHELLRTTVDLFIAGTDTTVTSLLWGVYLVSRHPEIQKAVQDELDEVLLDRCPSMEDYNKLVFTEAVLMEVQRFATVTPLGALPHKCIKDLPVGDYVIPKDSLVFANIFAAHRDEAVWPDPHRFNPENFYDRSTNSLRNKEFLIPFNVGRRSCLGESLVKQMLFLLFAGLVQRFDLIAPLDEPFSDRCLFGNQRSTVDYKIICRSRNK